MAKDPEEARKIVNETFRDIQKDWLKVDLPSNKLECLNCHVAFTTLNFADVSAVQTGFVPKYILGPTALQWKCPNLFPICFCTSCTESSLEVLWLYPYRL